MRGTLRAQDVICRWGGEEFIVLLPSTHPEGARVAAEKLRMAVASTPIKADDKPIDVTITIGGGVDPHAGDAVHDVIERADQALYIGKRDGRSRVVFDVDGVA